MKSVKIHVSGRVQGVFFRVYTQKLARELTDVTGYVRNLPDGRVEIFAEGSKESLTKIVDWAQNKGSPGSRIIKTDVDWHDIRICDFTDFQITY
ncbi:MAG: acylphosphatase [Candidatus Heimdallarchaeota archaeon]|nr:acylphosphatase [Candidatus Heimdallarchaeota archaeon]